MFLGSTNLSEAPEGVLNEVLIWVLSVIFLYKTV